MQNEVTSTSITCHASFNLLFWPAESWVSAEVDRDRNDFFLAMTERCLSNPKHQRNTHSEQAGDHPGCLCLLKNEVSSASITCHASFSLRSGRLEEIGAKTNGIHVREVCRVSRVSLARPVFSCACYFRLLRKLLGIE